MTTFLAYIGIGLLIVKAIAPFFRPFKKNNNQEEIDKALGFTEDSSNPII